ncbi:MAG: GNAT family N-acetyltransferase [Bacteroidota bacterium]
MTISIASAADIPALNYLINSAYRGEAAKKGWTTEAYLLEGTRTDETALAALLKIPGSAMLICRNHEELVSGCVYLQKQVDTFYLGMLTVSPLLQGAGMGRLLLQTSEAHVKKEKGRTISITVISVRHELIAWYERRGYAKTGETRPFPVDPAIGMPSQHLEFVVMRKIIA